MTFLWQRIETILVTLHDGLTIMKLDIVFRAARDGILSRLGRRRAASHY